MITSITSATAAATSAASSLIVPLAVGGALLAVTILIAHELVGRAEHGPRASVRRALRILAAPLLVVFVAGIVARAAEFLS